MKIGLELMAVGIAIGLLAMNCAMQWTKIWTLQGKAEALIAERGKKKLKVMLDPGAYMPTRAHDRDAGLDLYTPERVVLFPNSQTSVDLGVHIQIPKGYVGLITSKSGLMAQGITCRGTIDSGYTGSIKAVMYYSGSGERKIFEAGQKLTQLVILPCVLAELLQVDRLEDTDRGDNGFGSIGR